MKNTYLIVSYGLFAVTAAAVPFNPVALTPESYNADMIVESGSPPPLSTGVNVTLDGGTAKTGFTWYEVGYNANALLTGLPTAGSTFTHASDATKSYQMPASYAANNTLFISSQVTSGTFTLTSPVALQGISLLGSSGGGSCTMNYTITHQDTTTETGTLVIGDWFNGANRAYTVNGRVSLSDGSYNSVDNAIPAGGNPRIYGHQITFSNASPVASIALTYVSGGRCSLFAVSGSSDSEATYTPLAITGFNRDSVMGITDPPATALTTASNASMDGGTANTGNTFYQVGYNPDAPLTGLPAPSTTITSLALPDHHYQFPSSYTANNVIYVDQASSPRTITLATPEKYSALSFLNATANGAVTLECTMHFEDGSSEIKTFVAKDWFNNTPIAFHSQGRVNLGNRTFNNVNGNNPRLYEAEFILNNNVSKITSVDIAFLSGNANARVAILAVSATAGALAPIYDIYPTGQIQISGGDATIYATIAGGAEPMTFQWQKFIGGVWTNLVNGGNISGADSDSLFIEQALLSDQGTYRLVTSNAAGSTPTPGVDFTVRSSLPDVTSPYDAITGFGGGAPAGEAVENVVNNNTNKYLNFGTGAQPFVGPVGFIVTPAVGSSLVQALRIYTANDTEARDPADYILEGSNDAGATWSTISSGALALPGGRNGTGQTVNPLTQNLQEIHFSNATLYKSYRVTFSNVKDAPSVNSMQIAEFDLLGTFTPALTISQNPTTSEITVHTNRTALIQSSLTMTGADPVWTDVGNYNPGTPYVFSILPEEPKKFFRALPTE